jgi:hypothetical protein
MMLTPHHRCISLTRELLSASNKLAMDADLLTKSAIDIYRSLDTNGDGTLDKDEVRTSLAKFGYSEEEADKILSALDKGPCHPGSLRARPAECPREKFDLRHPNDCSVSRGVPALLPRFSPTFLIHPAPRRVFGPTLAPHKPSCATSREND